MKIGDRRSQEARTFLRRWRAQRLETFHLHYKKALVTPKKFHLTSRQCVRAVHCPLLELRSLAGTFFEIRAADAAASACTHSVVCKVPRNPRRSQVSLTGCLQVGIPIRLMMMISMDEW